MNKGSNLFSEIASFYSEKSEDYAMHIIGDTMKCINFSDYNLFRQHSKVKKSNELFHYAQILQILLLFPSFRVNGASHYTESDLFKVLSCHKDVFYRFMQDDTIDWRDVLYNITWQLWKKIKIQKKIDKAEGQNVLPTVFIVDDSDIEKTNYRSELVSRIFSHPQHRYIPGYKHLSLAINDGKTLMNLDVQLMRESKNSKDKPYGLSAEDKDKQYKKDYKKDSAIQSRIKDAEDEKPNVVMEMIKRAIDKGFRADYLLNDSWFTSSELLKFCTSNHMHLLGMVKMGKTKYDYTRQGWSEPKAYTANSLAAFLWKEERTRNNKKHHKKYGYYYMECNVKYKGQKAKMIFMRKNKKDKWKALLSSNLSLTFSEAYKIYSMRWAIEVSYGDEKGLLGLENCRQRSFAAQIAHETITCLTYNMLALVKRFSAYETIGELFRCSLEGAVKLSVTEKLWGLIQEIANALTKDESYPNSTDETIAIILEHSETVKSIQRICDRVA